MKTLTETLSFIIEASQKEYEDAIASNFLSTKKKELKRANSLINDPNDPNVLVRGFGIMRKSQAEKLKMNHEAFYSVTAYGSRGKGAQDVASGIQRGPTQQEMIEATQHVKDKRGAGHKLIGVRVGLNGKPQVKSAATQTRIVGEPVKEDTEKEEPSRTWGEGPDDPLSDIKTVEEMNEYYLNQVKETIINEKDISYAMENKLQMSMPLFIRLLEWAKEDCKSDVEIHQVAEKISAVNGVADMDVYQKLITFKGVDVKEEITLSETFTEREQKVRQTEANRVSVPSKNLAGSWVGQHIRDVVQKKDKWREHQDVTFNHTNTFTDASKAATKHFKNLGHNKIHVST